MTLALACLTPEFVTLVADRRVTFGYDVLDDLATKVVVVCDRGAVAYSGLARLPTRTLIDDCPRMDDWIVRILTAHPVTTLSEAARVLCSEATPLFRSFPVTVTPAQRRHAFMLAGWSLSSGGRRTPVLVTVSNALDERGEWLVTAEESFRQRVFANDPRKFSLHSIGAVVPQRTVDEVRRSLRRGFEKGIGPRSVLRMLVRAIRSVAIIDSSVSMHLLGVCVPPCALESGPRTILAGGPQPGSITFVDYKIPQEFGSWMGPHFVCGGSGLTGFMVGSLES